jgi:hypothetical protein
MSFKINGTAKYIDLGTGFWGIVTKDGKNYLPMPMPEQLKSEGHEVECRAVKIDAMNMFMWGETVKIVSFKTIQP